MYMDVCMYGCTCVCIYIYMYTYMYIYIYMYLLYYIMLLFIICCYVDVTSLPRRFFMPRVCPGLPSRAPLQLYYTICVYIYREREIYVCVQ